MLGNAGSLASRRVTQKHRRMQGAWIAFSAWAMKFVGLHPEALEKSCEGMSELLAGYIGYAYKSGEPFSHGKLALLAVQVDIDQ